MSTPAPTRASRSRSVVNGSATLRLGKVIAKDMARGSFSPSMQDLGEALVSHPNSAVEIVELLFAESRKKRQNQALVSALSSMLSRALESARWRKENQSLGANDLIDRVRNSVLKAAQQEGGSSKAVIMVRIASQRRRSISATRRVTCLSWPQAANLNP